MSSVRPAPIANSVEVPAGPMVVTRIPSSRSSRSSAAGEAHLGELGRRVDGLVGRRLGSPRPTPRSRCRPARPCASRGRRPGSARRSRRRWCRASSSAPRPCGRGSRRTCRSRRWRRACPGGRTARSAVATRRRLSSGERTSISTATIRPGISASRASSRSRRRAPTTTFAPAPASSRAVARPIPALAPVMATTVSFRSSIAPV